MIWLEIVHSALSQLQIVAALRFRSASCKNIVAPLLVFAEEVGLEPTNRF